MEIPVDWVGFVHKRELRCVKPVMLRDSDASPGSTGVFIAAELNVHII